MAVFPACHALFVYPLGLAMASIWALIATIIRRSEFCRCTFTILITHAP